MIILVDKKHSLNVGVSSLFIFLSEYNKNPKIYRTEEEKTQ